MFGETEREAAAALLNHCKKHGFSLAVAESCTGGLIAALLTEIPGSSAVFDRGFITYSNASKTQLLDVNPGLIAQHGAVSEPVAVAMAKGARLRAGVDVSVAVTGIAGPEGGSKEKPVGTVCIGAECAEGREVKTFHFSGNRSEIRLQAAMAALKMADELI